MRRGFILPIFLLLISIIFLLAVTRIYFTKEHLNQVVRNSDYERAYFLANSGLKIGKSVLNKVITFINSSDPATFPKRDKAPENIKNIVMLLLSEDGLPSQDGMDYVMESNLIDDLKGKSRDIKKFKVTFKFETVALLYEPNNNFWLATDPNEVSYIFSVHSEVQIEKATCKLVAFRESRMINITPPVVGKFVLFVKNQGMLNLNSVNDSKKIANLDNSPVIVSGGTSVNKNSLYTATDVRNLIDSQGWIYLGNNAPWEFALSKGGGKNEYEDALLNCSEFKYDMTPGEYLLSLNNKLYYSVFKYTCYKELQQEGFGNYLSIGKTSMLDLFGCKNTPVPNLIIGNVFRKWALCYGIARKDLPFKSFRFALPSLSETTFNSDTFPNVLQNDKDMIKSNFPSYSDYKKRMSSVLKRHYNSGNLSIIKFNGPINKILMKEPKYFPKGFGVIPPPELNRLKIDGNNSDFYLQAYGNSYELLNNSGQKLFEGNLDSFEDLGFLYQKVGLGIIPANSFFDLVKKDGNGHLLISGAIRVGSNLVIDRKIDIATGGGGLILVNGRITIKKGISTMPNEPLTLISLNDDISVETSEPVNAGLVALKGTVKLPKSFKINGLIAADNIHMTNFKGKAIREIKYNKSFDPTDTENYKKNYRLMVIDEWITYVE